MFRVDEVLSHYSNLFKVASDVITTGPSNVNKTLHERDQKIFIIDSGSLEKGFHDEVTLVLHCKVPGHVGSCTSKSLSA